MMGKTMAIFHAEHCTCPSMRCIDGGCTDCGRCVRLFEIGRLWSITAPLRKMNQA